ncbi:AAA family ATPase [Cellulophaga sp. 20_2_10]|uniref:AAA family ATPase n=1 Tax=Cellulophaga sp. 20_2_10 TaxID=2942476 RepID=UPI00201A6E9A|nr:AAA family ATPase [Cellulophaga sp. 20_2_10]MCL5245333.1 AAA family ATPase [Cellulophaga sp. 20_2_10]
MSIYQEILNWSQSRPLFIQDALRRIITSTTIVQNDIDELLLLLKKECGDTSIILNAIPLNNTHIPTSTSANGIYPKLVSLKNPINICALHSQGNLQFSKNGLNVVYGNNGSGKSSYSRILNKLCWSRNPSVELKKNVFNPISNQQQVELTIEHNSSNIDFTWTENSPSHPSLNSIFIFDNGCSDVYINGENPTEYKPIGIDVLEKLVSIFGELSQSLNLEVITLNTQKPIIDNSLSSSISAQWFANIENLIKTEIDTYIQFRQADIDRKQELIRLTNSQNPQQNIEVLNGRKIRLTNYIRQLSAIENLFSEQNITELIGIRTTFESTNQAYQISVNGLSELNTIEGLGNNPWRTLWDSAKNFAHSSNMSDGENFPSSESLEKCVLCQQDLDETAQQRLVAFNQFVLNDISTQLTAINSTIQQRKLSYNSLVIQPIENFAELEQSIPDFRNNYTQFTQLITTLKSRVVAYLENGGEFNITKPILSEHISSLIPAIDVQIQQNTQLLLNRNALDIELKELNTKEFLFANKTAILQNYDEYKFKAWISQCRAKLNTRTISIKIGEIMENQAVNLQHQEFISHLNSFNTELASKVLISRTRTSQGNTFQRCSLSGINDSINTVLSEGEQKIVALSNFLAECTIDGRLNSIIFDDPVTSLDMDYRDLIASKIVQLSQNRQIVVLTHDLSFLRLLIDTHKSVTTIDCAIIGIDKYNGISGIVTDEIPYLAKNVQERIDSIRRILREHDSLGLTDAHGRETKLDSARKRFRMLVERTVEEILSNKTYERFSKNIHLKKGNLSSYIVTEQSDIDFLLNLFGKYSITEHDGGTSTIPQLPNKTVIEQDITDYSNWKNTFKSKLRNFQATYN